MNGTANSSASPPRHLSDDLLLRYIENDLSVNELTEVEDHLSTCPTCFHLMAAVQREKLTIDDEAEIAELTHGMDFDPDARVRQLFPARLQKPIPAKASKSWWPSLQQLRPLWLPIGAAAAAAVILLFVIWPTVDDAEMSRQLTAEGLATMLDARKLNDREQPRPAGGFQFDPVGGDRRSSDEVPPEIQAARSQLRKALTLQPANAQALHALGTTFLFGSINLDSTQYYYEHALTLAPQNAAILNDLGVLAWRRGTLDEAGHFFSRALAIKPDFREAQYNQALLSEKLGNNEEAIAQWHRYLELDSDSPWARYAAARIEAEQQ